MPRAWAPSCDASGDRARHQLAGRDALRGQDAEADEVHADVGRDGESLTGNDDRGSVVTVGGQAGQERRDDHSEPEHGQEQRGAPQPLQVAGPRRPRQVPHLRHREQARLREPCRSPGQGQQGGCQADDAGAAALVDVAGELMADQRDLPGHRVQCPLPQRGVAGRHQGEEGHQDQQQREQGDEA